jgi:hypothetical protein
MRGLVGLVGCATVIAVAAFVCGLIGSLFATGASFGERMLIAVGVAAMAFAAAVILNVRDHVRYKATVRAVRRTLLARDDVAEADFLSHFPEIYPTLLGQIRQAISDYFQVPVGKIHPGDSLRSNFQCEKLEPMFQFFVVYHVFNARKVAPARGQPFVFNPGGLSGFGDLTKEIQRIMDGLDFDAAPTDGPS